MADKSGIGIVRTVSALRSRIRAWREDGLRIGLVPTMGALHDGHFSLIDRSVAGCDRTCVTLFVNPTQFGEGEDFDTYPRNEAADIQAAEAHGADLLFAPEAAEMYRPGAATRVSVDGLGDALEGEFRPGFFTGVATVVAKLLIQAAPDAAYFGEKDYQQLLLVRRMARDLDLPVEIVGCPIVREADGLACSSRNAYLNAKQRDIAPELHAVLVETAANLRDGDAEALAATAAKKLRDAGFTGVDYVAIRDPETLEPMTHPPARVLAAAWLGATRLIDNVPAPGPTPDK